MKKRFLFFFCLIAIMVVLALSVSAEELVSEINISQSSGDSVYARVYLTESGEQTLVVSGHGFMRRSGVNSLLSAYKSTVTSAVIEDGVLNVGANMFDSYTALTHVTLGQDIMEIGVYAFRSCSNLTSVNIPYGVAVIEANTFYGCSSLTEIFFPDSVMKINDRAMYNCAALEVVTFGEELTYIGTSAFESCRKLQSVSLPDTVENMGTHVFRNCTALENIKISKGLTAIGSSVFQGCYSLKSVEIPKRVVTIGSNAFQQCSALSDLTVEAGVLEIGNYAFDRCSKLQSVVLPDTVTYIGAWCFGNNQALSNVALGNGIVEIGANAFYACRTLAEIYIPSSVELVGDSAFGGCSALTIHLGTAYVPETWSASWNSSNCPVEFAVIHAHTYEKTVVKEPTHAETGLAEYCCVECGESYTQTISKIPHSYTITVKKESTHFENGEKEYSCECGYSYFISIAIIPHTYVGKTTVEPTHITEGITTYTCSCGHSYTEPIATLTEHTYVGSVTVEPTHSFDGEMRYTCECGSSYITTIKRLGHTYVDGVCDCGVERGKDPIEIWNISVSTRENVAAFLYEDVNIDGLYKLVISGSGRMRYNAYPWSEYRDYIRELVIEDDVKYEVPPNAFASYPVLEEVTIGKGIERINGGAFRLCSALQRVTVSEGLKRIEGNAFERCEALLEINGIVHLEIIGSRAFSQCTSLARLDAEIVKIIYDFAFERCTSLEYVNVVGGISVIRNGVFRDCQKLKEVKNIEFLEQFGRDVFTNCLELETLVLSKAVYKLDPSAFRNCSGLKNVIIMGNIESIPDYAFENCSNLKTVTIMSDIPISVGRYAFNRCYLLESVSNIGGFSNIGERAFGECKNLTGIMLTDGTETIGRGAFFYCDRMMEIVIPNSTTSIESSAFERCTNLTIYLSRGVDPSRFANFNPQNRPIVYDCEHFHFSDKIWCEHEHVDMSGSIVEIEASHFNIGLIVEKCSCGASMGHLQEVFPDHVFDNWKSESNAAHTRRCFCGYVEKETHTFGGNVCTGCGLNKSVLVLDDIESIEASNGKGSLEILFDGLKNTTGKGSISDIEYYPDNDRDYILITLKDEVDLGGIILWICGDKTASKVTVFDAANKKTGEGKIEFNGGDYSEDKSLPANITFFGTVRAKYIKIEAERLGKEGGLQQKISEVELVLGTKIDLDSDKPNTKIDLVLDIPTLNAIGVELTPELLEKLNKGLELNSDIGQIILDAISMGKVSATNGNVTIGINEITTDHESKTGKRVFSITVNDENGNPILPPDSSDENGTLTLSFKHHAALKKEQIKVVYRDENGKIQHMEVESYDPVTGIVQFKTNHLSEYMIYTDGISNDALLDGAFIFKGYSVNEATGQISVGYTIDYDVINDYEAIMERRVDFGMVFASYEFLDGQNPFDENGNVVTPTQGSVICSNLRDFGYQDYDFALMDLTEDYYDHEFVISAYVKGEDTVYYYQESGMSDAVMGITYNNALNYATEAK